MKRTSHLAQTLTALCLITSSAVQHAWAQDSQWTKYVPKKKRVSVIRPFTEAAGMGAALKTSTVSAVIWVTDPTARAIVSEMIDDERLSADEAEARYRTLRPGGVFTVLILVQAFSTSLYVAAPEILVAPFADNQTFLQRKDNKKIFSRGAVEPEPISFTLDGKPVKSCFVVHFGLTDADKTPVVGDPPGKLQVQYKLDTKEIVLDLDVGDWMK